MPSDVLKGTGLGLPICKEIVGHYGGDMCAESEMGKGSVFIFTPPVEQRVTAAQPLQTGDAEGAQAPPHGPKPDGA